MKTYESYIQELTIYGKQIISTHNVQSSNNGGVFENHITFFNDYENQLKKVSDQIIEKANEILTKAENASEIDNKKLKEDLTEICQNLTREFISQTNQKFKDG